MLALLFKLIVIIISLTLPFVHYFLFKKRENPHAAHMHNTTCSYCRETVSKAVPSYPSLNNTAGAKVRYKNHTPYT